MANNPIIFQVVEWREYNEDIVLPSGYHGYTEENSEMRRKYFFRLFGRTKDGKSVHVKCINFIPHFYVKLPQLYLKSQNKGVSDKEWLKLCCDRFIHELKNRNNYNKHHFLKYDIVKRCDFRTFTANKKFEFIRLVFDNSKAMKNFAHTLDNMISVPGIHNKLLKYELYENNIDPFLRAGHIRDLKFAGHIKVVNYANNEEIETSTCDINVLCDWSDLHSADETEKWSAPFKTLSYDIECDSRDKQFPRPKVTTHDQNGNKLALARPGDPVVQIGSVFSKYGSGIYRKHIIVLGTCDLPPDNDFEVVVVETEDELLREWVKLIHEEDPDFVFGYNTWGFDDEYMQIRAEQPDVNCLSEFCKQGRIVDHNCTFIRKELNSAGLGDNTLKYLDTPGRVKGDLMKVVQRDFKLIKYSLDFVAENFIQETIENHEILSDHVMKIFSKKGLHFVKVGNYVKLIDNAAAKYGLQEENDTPIVDTNDNDEDDDETDDKDETVKYKIIEIGNDYMVITHHKQKFTEKFMSDLGKGTKWGLVKDDLKPNDMFDLCKGNSADRLVVAKYCIQDCVLVSKLIDKLEIITNSIGMANVSSVPIYYLLTRGQGIKGLSLVAKECRKYNYLLPYLRVKEDEPNIGYEGAIVFDPKTGFYQSPIFVLDFNSLYPSSIISYNVSHETLVTSEEYMNLPNHTYKSITYKNNDGTTTTCIYAQKIDENGKPVFGILPALLQTLLSERKATKKLMKSEKDPFRKSILDGHQLALKVTANSVYGLLGTNKSPIGFVELAASTTAIGRLMLSTARDFAEQNLLPIMNLYNSAIKENNTARITELNDEYLEAKSEENIDFICKAIPEILDNYKMDMVTVMYGDSCTGDTPIILNINNELQIKRIDNFDESLWESYDGFKNIDMYNKAVNNGLMKAYNNKPDFNGLTYKEQINTANYDIKIWTHNGWAKVKRIIRHKTNKKIYRVLTKTGSVDVTEDHSLLNNKCEQIKPKDCTIGMELLHNCPKNIEQLKDKLIQICEDVSIDKENFKFTRFNKTSETYLVYDKLRAQEMYIMFKSMNYNVSIDFAYNLDNEIIGHYIHCTKGVVDNAYTIQQIYLLHEKYNDYVYDIETDTGTFHAGVGEMIIKNTDSIFCNPNIKDKETGLLVKEKRAVGIAIKVGQLASLFIKKNLLFPHNLEYEKTFYPFCIMAKKKYVGNKYEDDDKKCYLAYMGIVLKRRDNANIVKKVLGGLVNIMMYENDIDKALNYIKTMCVNLLEGKYPISDFVTTKALKSTYKGTKLTTTAEGNEGDVGRWHWTDVKCGQAHIRLCQRIKERDPGNAPNVNDRIPMVTIYKKKVKGVKYLQGDLVDTPEYIKENNVQIDYLFYLTNQIMNPTIQFLEHIIDSPKALFEDYILDEEKRRNGIKKIGIQVSDYVEKTVNNINDMYDDEIQFVHDKTMIKKPINCKEAIMMPPSFLENKKPRAKRGPTKQTKLKNSLYMDTIKDF